MPRIITGNPSQLGRAAGQAAFQLTQERERQDRLNAEAQRLALAERGLDLRQQSLEHGMSMDNRTFDFNTQQAQQENQRADTRLGLAVGQDQRQQQLVDRSLGQEDSDADFFISMAVEDGANPAELAGMSPDGLRQAANVLRFRRMTQEGQKRLRSLAGTVAETMGLQEGDPRTEAFRMMIEESGDSLEAQQEARRFMIEQQTEFLRIQAENQQRMANAEAFQPFMQNLTSTLPPTSAGVVASAFQLWSHGDIDDEEFLGQIQTAVKNARSGTTNRTTGEEFLTSASRAAGTEFGRGMGMGETRDLLTSARDIATTLDGGSPQQGQQPQPAQQQAPAGPTLRRSKLISEIGSADDLDSLLTDAGKFPPDRREEFVMQRVMRWGMDKGWDRQKVLQVAESVLNKVE